MMLSNHHRAKSCFFHLVYDTRKINQSYHAIVKTSPALPKKHHCPDCFCRIHAICGVMNKDDESTLYSQIFKTLCYYVMYKSMLCTMLEFRNLEARMQDWPRRTVNSWIFFAWYCLFVGTCHFYLSF
jgi:hypothetical protein